MNKYQPLTDHLKTYPLSNYPMNFKSIEEIIRNKLPASAYRYRAWWSNNPENSVMTKAWLDAGWISSDVDLEGQKLVFRRKPPQMALNTQPASGNGSITIEGLTAQTMANLKARSSLTGQSIAQTARRILEEHASLTAAERLALADRIRAESPKLHHVDVTGMIRSDRDSR